MFTKIYQRNADDVVSQRKQQINTLKVFNDNVTELQPDVEYSVGFTAGGQNMALIVTLPSQFPQEKPVIKISPPVSHTWVSEQGIVTGAPGLMNFTINSDLGRVVHAIIREFEKQLPAMSAVSASSSSSRQAYVESVNYGLPNIVTCSQNANNYFSAFPAAIPELSELSLSELERMKGSEDEVMDFIEKLTPLKQMNAEIDELIDRNESLAVENLAKESNLEEGRKVLIGKVNHIAELKNTYDQKSQLYQTISETYAPSNIKDLLRQAAVQSDEESEKIAEQFLNKEINIDQFLQHYTAARMLSHHRRVKEEKLHHQLLELQKAGF